MGFAKTEDTIPEWALDAHRALNSLIEELEAIDYYNQRAAATADAELKAVMEHNRDEEVEHATMVLEWLRRNMPAFDPNLRQYLFTSASITEIEGGAGEDKAPSADLGLGSLKK